MGKQRKGGLPYLKSSLRIDWDSGRGVSVVEQKALISDVLNWLLENGDCDEQSESASHTLCIFTANAGYGLQACLDLVKTETSPILFLDSLCPRPSAVANALGLYFNNYADTAKVYCFPGVEEMLNTKLNRKANAFALKNCPEELQKRIEATLTPVRLLTGRDRSSYTPVSLVKSMGKPDKVKK